MGGSVGRMDRKVRRDEIGQLHLVIRECDMCGVC